MRATGERHPNWRGGRTMNPYGYVLARAPRHPRSHKGYVYEHILVAERVLGRPLPPGAVVHHVNGDKADNRTENLVICPDQSYHKLIHARQTALEACGNPSWLRCCFCKGWDDPENLYVSPRRPRQQGRKIYHPDCRLAAERARREESR